MTKREHFVTFFSPGSFFAETTTKKIGSHDPVKAAKMAASITERHGAVPYGFQFETRIVSADVPDGEGGTLHVEPKTVQTSSRFLFGKLESFDDVVKRNDPRESTLRSNMQGNGYWLIAVSVRGYKSTQPFGADDVLIDDAGAVVERGDDPKHVAYRAACNEKRASERNRTKR